MTKWHDKEIRVRAKYLPRFLWTTASIDVYLADRCILKTGGQPKITGGTTSSFSEAGLDHNVELTWGRSRRFRFPYRLLIDGVLLEESIVPVENWYMIGVFALLVATWTFFVLGRFIFPKRTPFPPSQPESPQNVR